MKILQINSVCGVGSTGRIAKSIHDMLISDGHESYIAYGRNKAGNDPNIIKIGSMFDTYLHVAKTRVFDKHGFGSRSATLKFLKQVDKFESDIIHLHNIHGYYINIELLFEYLKHAGKPVVWTLHDCWAFTGHCSHFEHVQCDKWKSGCYKCPQINEYPSSFFADNSSANYKKKKELFTGVPDLQIVSPSKWLEGIVSESFLNGYPVKTIYNGIDLKTFYPRKSAIREKYNLKSKFIILGVANVWTDRKGLRYFYKLAEVVKDDIAIILVGLTEKQKKQSPEGIIGINRTDSVKELAELYSEADAFVNLTLEDTFPTTNLEAIACGTPVITFDTGGSSESVDKNTGIVIKKTDFTSILSAIEVIKNRGKEQYSAACRERAQALYGENERFYDYIELYSKVMQ